MGDRNYLPPLYINDVRNGRITPDADPSTNYPIEVVLPHFVDDRDKILKAQWGQYMGDKLTEAVNKTYSEVVRWKRNLFKVPTGKIGGEFIEEVCNPM